MPLKKLAGLAITAVAVGALAACSSTGGNPGLNAQAISSYTSPSAKSSLNANHERLGACIAQEAAKQRLAGARTVNTQAVAEVCEQFELAYRASVMAQVRPEWSNNPTVLNNTANTTTRNLYNAMLELFQ